MNKLAKREQETDVVEQDQEQELQQMRSNYFEQYGAIASQAPMTGTLLKFNKGDWTKGQDDEEVEKGTRFTAVMDDLTVGWVKWVDGKPEQQLMGRVLEGFQPARRKDLGDLDENEWDVDSNGRPRDPWQFTNHLPLRTVGTDGSDESDQYTYATSSRGGIAAIGELCKVYGKMLRQRPDEYPVVEVGVDSYVHKEYGRTKVPLLTVVDWESKVPAPPAKKSAPAKASSSKSAPPAKASGKRK